MGSRLRPSAPLSLCLLLAVLFGLAQCGGDSGSGVAGPRDPGSDAERVDVIVRVEESATFDGLRIAVEYPDGRVAFLSARTTGIAGDFQITSLQDAASRITATALGDPAQGPGDAARLVFSQDEGADVSASDFRIVLCLIREPGSGFRPASSCSLRVQDIPSDGIPELECQAPTSAQVGEPGTFTAFLTIDGLTPEDGTEVRFALTPGGAGTLTPSSAGTVGGQAQTQFLPSVEDVTLLLTAFTPDGKATCSRSVTVGAVTCPDADGDGFTDAACGGEDCDDNDALVKPGQAETDCVDGVDNDCDGVKDAFDPDCPFCQDADGDGFPDVGCGGNDCNDLNPAIHPDADEICGDGVDNDCDGGTDLGDDECRDCPDRDGDGFQDIACGGLDCDDEDPDVDPQAPEICDDGVDNDCDGNPDLADLSCLGCQDQDGDGWLEGACGGSDCDDRNPDRNPSAEEDCENGRDDDCDTLVDDQDPACFPCDDLDGDGFSDIACGGSDCNDADPSINPAQVERCDDGTDNNCNGLVDCAEGRCEARPCLDDGASCTDQICLGGSCRPIPVHTRCGLDSLFCNGEELCDPSDPNAGTSGCVPPVPPCDDPGSACDEAGDTCHEVDCADGGDNDRDGLTDCEDPDCAEQTCESDGIPCTQDVCRSGSCQSVPDDAVCDDGDFCNGISRCVPLDPTSGSDGCTPFQIPCTGDGVGCDEDRNACIEEDCGDGVDNDGDGRVDCDDLECVCTETDCGDGVDNDQDGQLDCDDPDCVDRPCDDGVDCTIQDVCDAGLCVGLPDNTRCADLMFCTGIETCNPLQGCISSGDPCSDPGAVCDEAADRCMETDCADMVDNDGDGTADCGDPECDALPCDDGGDCSSGDTCSGGLCIGIADDAACDNGAFCDGTESCLPLDPNADALGCVDQADPCLPSPDQWCSEAGDECRGCDEDRDGFLAEACGGDDCVDTNPAITPRSNENCFDGIDNDCDGDIDLADSTCG